MPIDVRVTEYRGPTGSELLHKFRGSAVTEDGNLTVDFFVDRIEAAAISRALDDGFTPTASVPVFMIDATSTALNGEVA